MVHAKRRLSQHFLSDPRILARIADALGAGAGDTVLEIGPGPGGLTDQLAARAGRLVAIEKDRELVPALRQRFPGATIVEGDALEVDWSEVAGPRFLVAGNIPYNITSPLIDKALAPPPPVRIVFLVQKEVADRVTAGAGERAYGALSVGVQSVARAERLFTVPAGAFHPRPKVDSAVLRLVPLAEPLVAPSSQGELSPPRGGNVRVPPQAARAWHARADRVERGSGRRHAVAGGAPAGRATGGPSAGGIRGAAPRAR